MAINYRVQENNQTVHFEGDAQITLTSDGSNVQAKLNELNSMLPEVQVGGMEPVNMSTKIWLDTTGEFIYYPYSNPNLLINSNFTNPINQRNATTYAQNKYFIDRWRRVSGSLTTINISSTYGLYIKGISISQVIELQNPIGKTLTASAQFCDEYGATKVVTFTTTLGTSSSSNTYFLFTPDPDNNFVEFAINNFTVPSDWGFGSSLYVTWAKVEIGSAATVYFHPDYSSELVKCQRYYYKLTSDGSARIYPTNSWWTTTINAILYLPTTMRILPTPSFSNNVDIWFGTQDGNQVTGYTPTQVEAGRFLPNQIELTMTTNKNVSGYDQWNLLVANGGYIELDAEIYL